MRIVTMTAAVLSTWLFFTSQASAGDIYGELKHENGLPVIGATLTATFASDDNTPIKARSGSKGRYRLRTPLTGPAKIHVVLNDSTKSSNAIKVYFFQASNRLNLKVSVSGNIVKLSKE